METKARTLLILKSHFSWSQNKLKLSNLVVLVSLCYEIEADVLATSSDSERNIGVLLS